MSKANPIPEDPTPPNAVTPAGGRARVLLAWRGHACGVWADFDADTLSAGVAAGALDPLADEAVYLEAISAR